MRFNFSARLLSVALPSVLSFCLAAGMMSLFPGKAAGPRMGLDGISQDTSPNTSTALDDRADKKAAEEIAGVLEQQRAAWNRGDAVEFMGTYWNSPELTFSAGGQTTRGWQATLERYQRRYPAGQMGSLTFSNLEVSLLGPDASFVLGNWHLEQDGEKFEGNFTLVLRRLDGKWLIVHDHSSSLEKE